MRALIAIRRFRYTRVAVFSPGYEPIFPEHTMKDIEKLEISNFSK